MFRIQFIAVAISAVVIVSAGRAAAQEPPEIVIAPPAFVDPASPYAADYVRREVARQARRICGAFPGPKPVARRMEIERCVAAVTDEALRKSGSPGMARRPHAE